MKNNLIKIKWLIPILGIASLAGSLVGAATYIELQREAHSGEAHHAALGHLWLDQGLCCVLRSMHQGDVNSAAQQLDRLLCGDIIGINSELGSAGAADRAFVTNAFAHFVLVRPKSAALLAGTGQELSDDQLEAARILEHAANGITPGNKSLAVLP
jgi:hypothetical protein